jgi:tripartite motif-containing protein 71
VLITSWGSDYFADPAGLAADVLGNIYVADKINQCVVEFTGSGGFLAMWNVLPPPPGSLTRPGDVAVDQNGNVYVVDPETATVQKYGDQPVPTTPTTWGRVKAERR